MDKTQILALVQQKINEGVIVKEDINTLFGQDTHVVEESKKTVHTRNVTHIFYVIGAIIAIIGVIILLAQNWLEIGFAGRMLSTLGISIIAYAIAFAMTGPTHRILSQVLFTISGVLAPIGTFVLCEELGITVDAFLYAVASSIFLALFLTAFVYTKRNILILWSLLWATGAYFAFLEYAFDLTGDITKLASMVAGVGYLCIAYFIQKNISHDGTEENKEKETVQNITYGVGTLLVIIPSLFFSGIFDLISLLLIFGAFYLSIFVKSRLTLLISGVLLIAYILKITSEYFVDSIGWPVALIGIGFLVIGIGYGTLYVSRTYIPKSKE